MTSPDVADYLSEVLDLDPSEDAIELMLRRRAHLGLSHPPACPPPFAHLPRRLRASALLDELRDSLPTARAEEVLQRGSELREIALPDQVGQLERLLCFWREREAFLGLRARLGDELSELLEGVWLGQVGESVPLAEEYLESLSDRPGARTGLRQRVALVRRSVPGLAELEPELLLALERRDQGRSRQGRTPLAIGALVLVYVLMRLLEVWGK
ncbi:MAG: hypothetical protein JKY65_00475 [Planctomycetes bacterium]|nr:hypothetical protein [Planctomycetota bacterium]